MITVIDAMNANGQDWECSEVLRAEVLRLTMFSNERERQYRDDWQSLRADLAAAEQRASEGKIRAERLAAALDAIEVIAHPPGCTEQGIHDIWTIARAALDAADLALTPAPRQAAEREAIMRVIEAAKRYRRGFMGIGIANAEQGENERTFFAAVDALLVMESERAPADTTKENQ